MASYNKAKYRIVGNICERNFIWTNRGIEHFAVKTRTGGWDMHKFRGENIHRWLSNCEIHESSPLYDKYRRESIKFNDKGRLMTNSEKKREE
jgi:hypothetical protein